MNVLFKHEDLQMFGFKLTNTSNFHPLEVYRFVMIFSICNGACRFVMMHAVLL